MDPSRHTVLWLAAGFVTGLVALTLPPTARAAGPAPEAIAKLYGDLRIATEMRDLETIQAHFAPVLRLSGSLGQGWINDLAVIFQQRENLAVEVKLEEVKVVGERALVLATWALAGKTKDTGEAWNTTVKRADWLVRHGQDWQLLASQALDPLGQAKVADGVYRDEKTGLEVSAPQEWRLLPLGSGRAAVVASSPDLTVALAWAVIDVPGTFTAEQLARADEDAVTKLLPTLGIKIKDPSSGPATLAGRPSYESRRTLVGEGGVEFLTYQNYCAIGSTLYAATVFAFPPGALANHQAAIDRALAATKIAAPTAVALPPEAGRVDGGKYVNDTYGCEITAPEGWETKIEKGDWKLQVSMREPDGGSSISLGMIELPEGNITAQQAIEGDDGVSQQAFEQFKLIRRGDTTVGGLPAYESVSQFTLGGQTRWRWRLYLVDGNRLFFMWADATPADNSARLEKAFRGTFQSFKIGEAKKP